VELITDKRLTPGEVQEQVTSIPLARLGRRGLDPEEVRAFCARLEHELVLRDKEAASMQQDIQKLRMRVIQGPDEDTPATAFQPGETHIQVVSMLAKGQATVDRIVADAQAYSAEMAHDARRRKSEIIADARAHAALIVDEAHREASKAAAAVPAPSSPASPDELQTARAELVRLQTYIDVLLDHMQAFTETQMHMLDDWKRSRQVKLAEAGNSERGRAS